MTVDRLTSLETAVTSFANEREWGEFHDPKNLAMALVSEAGELCAALRWIDNKQADAASMNNPTRDALLAEIGDVAIVLLLLCSRIGTSLDETITAKLAANQIKYPIYLSRGRADKP